MSSKIQLPAAGFLPLASFPRSLPALLPYSVDNYPEVLFLFTKSDLKTILIPVTIFACLSTPDLHIARVVPAMWWTWLHLLQFCVSNQSKDPEEDATNKPWRPIPSKRISLEAAHALRWMLLPVCLLQSITYGVPWQGLSLTIAFLAHNEFGLDSHWFMRNFCNAWGYASFNAGAIAVASSFSGHALSARAIMSFGCNAAIILTTIHAQDFRDEIGDRLLGRRTLPIVWPEASRIAMLTLLPIWSLGLSFCCNINVPCTIAFCAFSIFVGIRFYFLRDVESDKQSYLYYNMWLAIAQIIHTPVIASVLREQCL